MSPAGDDHAPGSKDAPWKNIAKANLSLKPGDTAIFSDGEYAGVIQPLLNGVQDKRGHISYITYHSNTGARRLLRPFGIEPQWDAMFDPLNHVFNDPRCITFTNFSCHPVTEGVKKFQSFGGTSIKINPVKGDTKIEVQTLIRGSPSSYSLMNKDSGLSVLTAGRFGQGRVVVVGGCTWLLCDNLLAGDNAQFFLNIISWLNGESSVRLSPDETDLMAKFAAWPQWP